ncbi:hypothetical protein CVT25_010150 [Psilocybe cyanescens]|uniref:Uncharacterized protein n=1 Tax=Psilocybe cyanescens TaxID=93625 RepID=A0A409XJ48_PSICY|nr:hypothetical protein CVT25_010150 [Psilocybe cyanescens]
METTSHSGNSLTSPRDSKTYPYLPTELLEQILTEAWLSLMSPSERRDFVKAISRAFKIWSATLARICSRDVYTSLPPSSRNRHSIEEELPLRWGTLPDYPPFQLCRSFTQQILLPSYADPSLDSFTRFGRLRKRAMKDLLSTFRGISYAPNISELSVEYFSPASNENRSSSQIIALHLAIVRLEVEYTFSSDTPLWLIDELGLTGRRKQGKSIHAPWEVPDLDHISTSDTGPSSFGDVLRLCPHLEMPTTQSFGINLRILSSSDIVPQYSSIVHGPISFPVIRKWMPENAKNQNRNGRIPEIISGKALGLVLDNPTHSRGRCLHLTNATRTIGVFSQRSESY